MNTSITLEALGLSAEELQNRVVAAACEQLLSTTGYDSEDDATFFDTSKMAKKILTQMELALDRKFETLGREVVEPVINARINDLTIQTTNRFGEKTGGPATFVEFLVAKAEEYLAAPVDGKGRTAEECKRSGDSFYKATGANRLSIAIDKALAGHFKNCIDVILRDAHSKLETALADTLKTALEEAKTKIKVKIT